MSTDFRIQPIDKENSSSFVKNKQVLVKQGSLNKQPLGDCSNNIQRRALVDVKNIKQHNFKNTQKSLKTNDDLPFKSISKPKQNQNLLTKENDTVEEIEFNNIGLTYDNFNDILSEKQKLSTLLLNAKCIPLLPTHSAGEFNIYNDNLNPLPMMKEKKVKKEMKKIGKSIQKSILANESNSIKFEELDLFAPPSDW